MPRPPFSSSGVLPELRGQRYVDQLIYAAYRAARTRGFQGVLSLVDVENHPDGGNAAH
jgi:ribosomal protein S18 acetylase RimI-like enzyme